jgi:ribosome maturation factor RimP
VIEPVLHAMDIDLEAVKIARAGRRRVLRVIVDADGGVSLDDIAEVSRELSARLDAKDAMGDGPHTLEVSSPGVDRSLTQPRHWRRDRQAAIAPMTGPDHDSEQGSPADPVTLTGRVLDADRGRHARNRWCEAGELRRAGAGPGTDSSAASDEGDIEADGAGDLGDGGALPRAFQGSHPRPAPDEEGPDGH